MSKPAEKILMLIEAGANVTVPADKPVEKLVELARAAKRRGVRLTISQADSKPVEKLIEVIEAGGGCVDIIL